MRSGSLRPVLAIFWVLLVAEAATPVFTVPHLLTFCLIEALAAALILVGVARHRPPIARSWYAWSLSSFIFVVYVLVAMPSLLSGAAAQHRLFPDHGLVLLTLLLVTELVWIGGYLLLVRSRMPPIGLPALLDWMILTLGTGTVISAGSDVRAGQVVTFVSSWFATALATGVFGVLFRMLRTPENRLPSLWLLTASLGTAFLSSFVGDTTPGRTAILLLMVSVTVMMLAFAALHPSMAQLSSPLGAGSVQRESPRVWRVVLLTAAVLVSPATVMYMHAQGREPGIGWLVGSLLLLMSVGTRLALAYGWQARAERELMAGLAEQQAVARLSQLASQRPGRLPLMRAAADALVQALGVSHSAVFEYEPQDDMLVLRTDAGLLPRGAPAPQLPASPENPAGAAWLDGSAVVHDHPALTPLGIRSTACVIVEGRDRPLGVIGAVSAGMRPFAERDIAFMKAIAFVLGSALAQQAAEQELEQARKLESVGRLAAGVAHEINTPVQFVADNLRFLDDAVQTLAAAARGDVTDPEDVDYFRAEAPDAIAQALEGIERVSVIVRAMKVFSHADRQGMVAADLNDALRSTLAIARPETRPVAEVQTDFGELPDVVCNVGRLNQVFLNLVVNAAHAIEAAVAGTGSIGTITIRTRALGDQVEISIADSGTGIPSEVQHQIFEPFFTTKEVGKGTGQGLALARTVVVEHGGQITFDTGPGGTVFRIRLPVGGAGSSRPDGEQTTAPALTTS